MKHILITIFLIGSLNASIIIPFQGEGIQSSATLNDGVWRYEYSISSQPLDGKHDISNVSISLCNSANIFDAYASGLFTPEITPTSFKWDSITPLGDTFVFGFSSLMEPQWTDAFIKASTQTEKFEVLAPTCLVTPGQVPEPTAAIILGFSALTLLRRKR